MAVVMVVVDGDGYDHHRGDGGDDDGKGMFVLLPLPSKLISNCALHGSLKGTEGLQYIFFMSSGSTYSHNSASWSKVINQHMCAIGVLL